MLVGQLELQPKLERPELRQLDQRISIRYRLRALNLEETKRYIEHRLFVAGSNGSVVFSDPAYDEIYDFTRGVPRLVNLLCERCLLGAFVDQQRKVDRELVRRCRASLAGDHEQPAAAARQAVPVAAEPPKPVPAVAVRPAPSPPVSRPLPPVARPLASAQRAPRRPKRWSRLLVPLVVVAGLACLWLGLELVRSGTKPPVHGRARAAQAAAPAASAPAPAPAVRLAWSLQLGAFQELEDGLEQQRLLAEQGLGPGLYIVPLHLVNLGGRWYRLFYGGFPSPQAARDELNRLVERGLIPAGSARAVETPLAFSLGEYPGPDSAGRKAQDYLERWRIPAYALPLEERDGHSLYRLYTGAFESREQASFLADRLQDAGLKTELVERLGRWNGN